MKNEIWVELTNQVPVFMCIEESGEILVRPREKQESNLYNTV